MSDRTKLFARSPIIPRVCGEPGRQGLVSVVIPSYNRAYILGAAIKSALAQTYQPIEIIVVDDGSRDDTRAVVENCGSYVKYIYQENAGLASARNTGLAAARGEFIAFLDSDDTWLPWKLKAQVAILTRFPELALVWTDMTAIDANGAVLQDTYLDTMYHVYSIIRKEEYLRESGHVGDVCQDCPAEVRSASFRHGNIFSAMFMGNLVHPPTAVMRRSQIARAGGLDLTLSGTCEDYDLFWRVSEHGPAALIEFPSILYRVDAEDQLTRPELMKDLARGNLLALERRVDGAHGQLMLPGRMIRRQMAEAHAWVGEQEFFTDDESADAGHFLKSLALNPFRGRILALLFLSLIPRPVFRFLQSFKRRVAAMKLAASGC